MEEHDVDVVVLARGVAGIADAQRAGHPEVYQQPARCALQFDQQVLGAPPAAQNLAPFGLPDLFRYWPAQAGVTHHDARNPPAIEKRRNAPQGGFDFGQFGHVVRLLSFPAADKKPASGAGFMVHAEASVT